jgi:uroporphyrinogen-III synthase
LVVRSGANPFASVGESERLEIVEKVSHSIEPVDPGEEPFRTPASYAIFTSQVAVERCETDASLRRRLERAIAGGQVAAVGAATAEALTRHGIVPRLVARGSAENILQLLPEDLGGQRILLPCGEDASTELSEGLRQRGAHAVRAVVYRKVARPRDAGLDREILEKPFAVFCATSPSAARWLFEGLSGSAMARLRKTPAVVLGRFTRRFLEAHRVERIEVTPEARFGAALGVLERLAGEGSVKDPRLKT